MKALTPQQRIELFFSHYERIKAIRLQGEADRIRAFAAIDSRHPAKVTE